MIPPTRKRCSYTAEAQSYILNIMHEFELCYPYDRRKTQYIIPDLLPKELPQEPTLTGDPLLRFHLAYDYLPTSIIPRLMLRLHHDIEPGQQWRYGMVLRDQEHGCRALIRSTPSERTIEITVSGPDHWRRQYFTTIRHTLQGIQREFENLRPDESIPLPGFPDTQVGYGELLGYEQAKRYEYFAGTLRQSFSVSKLLDSIVSPQERQQEQQTVIYNQQQIHHGDKIDMGGNFGGAAVNLKSELKNTTQTIENRPQPPAHQTSLMKSVNDLEKQIAQSGEAHTAGFKKLSKRVARYLSDLADEDEEAIESSRGLLQKSAASLTHTFPAIAKIAITIAQTAAPPITNPSHRNQHP